MFKAIVSQFKVCNQAGYDKANRKLVIILVTLLIGLSAVAVLRGLA